MKIQDFAFTFFIGVLLSDISFSTEFDKEDKENHCPQPNMNQKLYSSSSSIYTTLETIQAQLDKGHKKADRKLIERAYKTFNKLKYTSKEWKAAALSLKANKWPSQKTARKIVGGHLFYPTNITELLDSPYTARIIQRPDMLRSLEFAAAFCHPLGLYYLTYAVDTIRSEATDEEKPEYFKKVYHKALKELEQCQNNSEVCYILGRNFTKDTIKTKVFNIDPQRGYQIYSKGTDPRARLAALVVRQEYKSFENPNLQEYEDIAREGYGPAYIKLAQLSQDFNKEIEYLTQACQLGFDPALIDMGLLYKNNHNPQAALQHFEKAGQKGIAEGYINLGIMKTGRILAREAREELIKKASKEDIQEAISYFQQAGKLHYARAWDYLAILYIELFKLTQDKAYVSKIRKSLFKGARLGSTRAYEYILEFFPNELKKVGVPVHQDLYEKLSKLA